MLKTVPEMKPSQISKLGLRDFWPTDNHSPSVIKVQAELQMSH